MARYRGFKEEYFQDKKVSKLSHMGRLLFMGMWLQSDDAGVCRFDPYLLRNQIFPYDKIEIDEIEREIIKMCLLHLIVVIEQNEQSYFWVRTFLKHQQINRPSKYRYINPGEFVTFYEPKGSIESINISSMSTQCFLNEHSVSNHVQVSYKGDKNNEIVFIKDDLKSLESTIFPDPNDDQEYYDFIMESKMGKICPVCQRKYSLNKKDIHDTFPTIDHIIPRSKGGDHSPDNLQVICASCNSKKYNTPTLLSEHSVSIPGGLIPYASTKEKKIKEQEYKRERERESENEDFVYDFDRFWCEYPRKEDKAKAEVAYRKALQLVGNDLISETIYKHPKMKNSETKFIPLAHNFLATSPWQDLMDKKDFGKNWKKLLEEYGNRSIDHDQARKIFDDRIKN